MQFLKTLFWVALAVILVLFSRANWEAVTLRLWGGLEVDVKLPVLLLTLFLLGFLPMFIIHRARLWSMNRRLEAQARQVAAVQNVPVGPGYSPAPDAPQEERVASDAKAWPAA